MGSHEDPSWISGNNSWRPPPSEDTPPEPDDNAPQPNADKPAHPTPVADKPSHQDSLCKSPLNANDTQQTNPISSAHHAPREPYLETCRDELVSPEPHLAPPKHPPAVTQRLQANTSTLCTALESLRTWCPWTLEQLLYHFLLQLSVALIPVIYFTYFAPPIGPVPTIETQIPRCLPPRRLVPATSPPDLELYPSHLPTCNFSSPTSAISRHVQSHLALDCNTTLPERSIHRLQSCLSSIPTQCHLPSPPTPQKIGTADMVEASYDEAITSYRESMWRNDTMKIIVDLECAEILAQIMAWLDLARVDRARHG